MLNELRLQNFGKVEDSTLTFQKGLTALRGANEAGKSTRYKAVLYALFGARALPMSLSETVTWGKPESSLRVTLLFTYDGKQYTIIRSKSGARLTAEGLEVNGQSEVTSYIENLFEVNADAASRIMIASQNALRSSLDNKSTVGLIEKLANLSLIDDLVSKCKAQLPNGDIAMLLEQLKYVEGLVEPSDTPMIEAIEQATKAASAVVDAKAIHSYLSSMIDNQLVSDTHRKLATYATELHEYNMALVSKDSLESRLLQAELRDNSYNLSRAQEDIANLRDHREKSKAWANYKKFVHYTGMRYASKDAYDSAMKVAATLGKEATAKIADIQRKSAMLRGALITQTTCGLCGKDLTDVPEVTDKNNSFIKQIGELEADIPRLKAQETEAEQVCLKLLALNLNAEHSKALTLTSKWVEMDNTMFPATPIWVGGDMPESGEAEPDYFAELYKQEGLYAKFMQDQTERKLTAQRLEIVKGVLASFKEVDTDRLQAILDNQAKVVTDTAVALAQVKSAELAATMANTNAEQATSSYEKAKEQYLKGLEQKAKLEATLVAYNENNTLIKDLRVARPQVAATLWQSVLSTISSYFSQIRGTQSVVTIEGNVFKVDGHDAEAQSGSTLDSLGLAIRIALGKTFLPTVDFLLLDEPASGMDDDRESAMLGTLAGVGYNQVIVVTHSELCDTFADQVIMV